MSHPKGHSLLEVMVVVALLSALAALGIQGFQGMSTRTRGADALAKVVADHFRQTRAKAISDAVPTALVFPSDNGAKPHSQSCFVVSGEDKPKIRRVYDFSGEFSKSCVFVGLTGAAGETLSRPLVGDKLAGFRARNWYPTRDYQFIFLPSGAVVCNDLPLVDGKYSVIVAAGLEFIGAAPPAPPSDPVAPPPRYFKISKALDPFTITISAEAGEVEVGPGVVGTTTGRDGWTTSPASPPPLAAGAPGDPTILDLQIRPEPNPANLPPGLDATVRDGECLSFLVTATDNQGGPLFCEMTVEDPVGNPVEGLTVPGAQAMAFDRAGRQWTSGSTWSPPPTHPPGTIYTVNCIVTDKDTGSATLDAAVAPRVEKRRGGKFLLHGAGGGQTLAVIHDDGSTFRWIPGFSSTYGGHFTPDGKLVNGGQSLAAIDGLTPTRTLGFLEHPSDTRCVFTPDGGSLLQEGVNCIKLYSVSTGALQLLYPPASGGTRFAEVRCSPTGNQIAYLRDGALPPDRLCIADWDRATNTISSEVFISNNATSPRFSPAGDRLSWSRGDELSICDTDGTNLVGADLNMISSNAAWSPGGDRIAFVSATEPNKILVVPSSDLSASPQRIDISPLTATGFAPLTVEWSK